MQVRGSQILSFRRVLAGLFVGAIGLMTPTALGQDLPKAEDVIDKYIKVTGGKEAYEKRQDITVTSSVEFKGQGMSAKATGYQAAPAKSYNVIEIEGMGKIEEGYDGKVAWETNPMTGPRIKEGNELEFAIRTATFNGELHWKKLYKSAETVGSEDIDGKKAFKLKLTPNKGKDEFQFYDAESGLLVKSTATIDSQMGELPVETKYVEYKEMGGVKLPVKVMQVVGGGMQTLEITIEKVEVNTKIPDSKFELPKEIKELLDKPKATASAPAAKPEAKKDEPKKP
ncbi:MAG: hypothetical protein ACKVS9_07935 [Phycisphaerae bacterium]